MAASDVSTSVQLPAAPRRRRRALWLLLAILLALGGVLACEGWAAWQERSAHRATTDDRLAEAQRHIDLALHIPFRRVSTYLLAARIARLRGEFAEAERLLTYCGEREGMSARVQLEWLLLRCQRGQVDELAPQLWALVEQGHPESAAILETLARVYMVQTRYLEALQCLNRWIELNPHSVRALDWRGWVGNQLDHRGETFADYEHLLQLQPDRTDIRLRLTQALVLSSRFEDAVPHAERLYREMPDNPDVLVALASCRIAQTRMEEARALLAEVLKEHPDHFDALFQLGRLELTLGQPAEAEPWLRAALAQKPHDADARYALFQCLQKQPNRQEEAESENARWKEENTIQTRLTRLIRRELVAHPNDADLACETGELLMQQGEEKRGLFWLQRAAALDPRHLPTHRALLAYYERTHNTEQAEEERHQVEALEAKK
jgi:tetratricopeptide (TPR) repeat protein